MTFLGQELRQPRRVGVGKKKREEGKRVSLLRESVQ